MSLDSSTLKNEMLIDISISFLSVDESRLIVCLSDVEMLINCCMTLVVVVVVAVAVLLVCWW